VLIKNVIFKKKDPADGRLPHEKTYLSADETDGMDCVR
jgi:hypothetical protein